MQHIPNKRSLACTVTPHHPWLLVSVAAAERAEGMVQRESLEAFMVLGLA